MRKIISLKKHLSQRYQMWFGFPKSTVKKQVHTGRLENDNDLNRTRCPSGANEQKIICTVKKIPFMTPLQLKSALQGVGAHVSFVSD